MFNLIKKIKEYFKQPKFKKGETVRVSTGELFGAKSGIITKIIKAIPHYKNASDFYYEINGELITEDKISKYKL